MSRPKMKLYIPLEEIDNYGCRELIPLICELCGDKYHKQKNLVLRGLKGTRIIKYCSRECNTLSKKALVTRVNCKECGSSFSRPDKYRAAVYCSRICASRGSRTEDGKQKFLKNRKQSIKLITLIRYSNCTKCDKLFVSSKWSRKRCCSASCRTKRNSDRCKVTKGMCKNNNRHAGWYESPIAGKVWLESSWEVRCAKMLDKHQIEWRRPNESFLWTDIMGRSHRYYPDFYIKESDLYLDPKNPHAQERDAYKIKEVKQNHPIKLLILSEADIEETRFLRLIKNGAVERI